MRRNLFHIVLATAIAAVLTGCRDRSTPPPGSQPAESDEVDRIEPHGDEAPEVIFPAALRTDDPSLNRFIDDVLGFCARGDYGMYRLAVGSQYEPLPRKSFERAWHAVKEVRVRKVIRVHEPATRMAGSAPAEAREELRNPIYCVHGTILLRDNQRPRPVREVVVLVIKENGEWKLGPPAPPAIKQRIMGTDAPAGDLVNPAMFDRPAPEPSTAP
ncbi:MAG: hypothetical protein ACPMAQ_17595, partial [Phycisphaerae bacterium]